MIFHEKVITATVVPPTDTIFEKCFSAHVFVITSLVFASLAWGVAQFVTLLPVLSAVAVAGIPGGSLPPEVIGIVLGVDRVLDMLRTTVNVGSDIVSATVMDAQVRKVISLGEESVSVSGD